MFSLTYLKRSQNIYIRLQLGKIISHNEYSTEYCLFTLVILWLAGSCGSLPLSSIISIVPHVTSPGKDQSSKFQIQILLNVHCLCTIVKPKKIIISQNHGKSGTISIGILSCIALHCGVLSCVFLASTH